MSASPEIVSDNSDSTYKMSYTSKTTSSDYSNQIQTINFDNYIKWHNITYLYPSPNAPSESSLNPTYILLTSRSIAIILLSCKADKLYQKLYYFVELTELQPRARYEIFLNFLQQIVYHNSVFQSNNSLIKHQQCKSFG